MFHGRRLVSLALGHQNLNKGIVCTREHLLLKSGADLQATQVIPPTLLGYVSK